MHDAIAILHGKRDAVTRENHHRQIVHTIGSIDELHVGRIELAIAHFALNLNRRIGLEWNGEQKMRHIARARRNLVVEQRQKNILWVAAINTIAFAIDHERVVGSAPRIERATCSQRTDAADLAAFHRSARVQPCFVGISSALGELVANVECAHHDFEQIGLTRAQSRK